MEWIPQSVYPLCFNCCSHFPCERYLRGDLPTVSLYQLVGCEVGRPIEAESCGINRFLLAIPGTAFQKILLSPFLSINPHMLKRETEECVGWRANRARAGDGGMLWWDPPLDTAAFSACVNKTSLNCLIILCKLRDQGTYWKPPSKHSAECVSVFKPSLLSPHALVQT